ncbi:hypothetical protein O0L34_g18232 [Tuta absoluta]|nr:hypothetical protein O0L34_g18232 [Tuta absoluta]
MSHLYLPWGSGERYTNRLQVRNQFASTLDLHKDSSYDYQESMQRQRSPSLPPIHHLEQERKEERKAKEVHTINRNIPSAKRFAFYDEDGEGDTSGYGSETVNHIRGGLHNVSGHNPVMAWHQDDKDRSNGHWSVHSPRSGAGTDGESRPRWGDRGVATGRLWEPTNPTARLPQMPNQNKGTPSWVERGLNMIENTADLLVIDQRSPNSGFDCDRSSCNGSDEGRTFLRGQNVPLEPEIKAQRENQRLKALELQSAILNQLEDREKRRQEELEMKRREERLEEIRIQRQQEEDRIRLEEEKRRNEEKQLCEQRKLETLKKALEEAERKAKLEKEKRFHSLKQNLSSSSVPSDIKLRVEESVSTESPTRTETRSPTKSNRTYDVHSAHSVKSPKKDTNSQQTTEFNSPRSLGPGPGNVNLYIHNVPPLALADNQFNIVPIGFNGNGELVNSQPNSIQLAVLVPQSLNNSLYSVSLNSLSNINDLSESGKVLTPRKYRIAKTRDVSTQTDTNLCKTTDKSLETEAERNFDKDYAIIDENAPQENIHNTMKKDRRRSEERFKKDLENRPKWGVNRPVAQYKKQSEKDPFYSQKRKLRQKYRSQARQYLSQSSDDSRSPSPPTRSDKTSNNQKPRNSLSQSYWRNKRSSQDLSRTSEATTNIDTEFVNLSQITANNDLPEHKKSPKMSPSKRITLSQKFINDKYGNRKLWIDDVNERNSKSNIFDVENRKKIIDQINTAKRDYLERNIEDHDNLVIKNKF